MKTILFLAVLAIIIGLAGCANDNTSVKQIVEVINDGYVQHHAIEKGEIDLSDLKDGEYFNWPDGNIFANDKIWKIIKANAEYSLTDEDKAMLTEAVEQFIVANADPDDILAIGTNIMADHAKDTIRSSKKLKDLYAHGLLN